MTRFFERPRVQQFCTQIAGPIAQNTIPWLKNWIIRQFMKQYPVDLSEALITDYRAYPSFQDFFTRALKPSVRPLASTTFVSPADGTISVCGAIKAGTLIQAKHHTYSVSALLCEPESTPTFQHGQYATIYLAPHNYHRVHMPIKGTLQKTVYVPGMLFSVNTETTQRIPNLFAQNERLICWFKTDVGTVVVIFVGACIVGGIQTVWAKQNPDRRQHTQPVQIEYQDQGLLFEKGEEIGLFKLGSTVIVLSESESIPLKPKQSTIKMGEALSPNH